MKTHDLKSLTTYLRRLKYIPPRRPTDEPQNYDADDDSRPAFLAEICTRLAARDIERAWKLLRTHPPWYRPLPITMAMATDRSETSLGEEERVANPYCRFEGLMLGPAAGKSLKLLSFMNPFQVDASVSAMARRLHHNFMAYMW